MSIPYENLATPDGSTPWAKAIPAAGKEWAVLWLQGWESTIESQYDAVIRLSKASNLPFFMIDYAGFGKHSTPLGETTREQQHLQVVAAYDAIKAQGYEKIITIGYSFGGYMSALLSSQRPLAGMVLRAPAIYDDAEFAVKQSLRNDRSYKEFRPTVQPGSRLNALEAVRKYNGPVYVLEHGEDEVIPENIPKSYFACARQGNYAYLPGLPHGLESLPNARAGYDYIETITLSALALIQKEDEIVRA